MSTQIKILAEYDDYDKALESTKTSAIKQVPQRQNIYQLTAPKRQGCKLVVL